MLKTEKKPNFIINRIINMFLTLAIGQWLVVSVDVGISFHQRLVTTDS
jgi:hypothetical protein